MDPCLRVTINPFGQFLSEDNSVIFFNSYPSLFILFTYLIVGTLAKVQTFPVTRNAFFPWDNEKKSWYLREYKLVQGLEAKCPSLPPKAASLYLERYAEPLKDFNREERCNQICIVMWRADWRWFVFKIRKPVPERWPTRVSLPGPHLTGCGLSRNIQHQGRVGLKSSLGSSLRSTHNTILEVGHYKWRKVSCPNLHKGAHGLVTVLIAIFWVIELKQ